MQAGGWRGEGSEEEEDEAGIRGEALGTPPALRGGSCHQGDATRFLLPGAHQGLAGGTHRDPDPRGLGGSPVTSVRLPGDLAALQSGSIPAGAPTRSHALPASRLRDTEL